MGNSLSLSVFNSELLVYHIGILASVVTMFLQRTVEGFSVFQLVMDVNIIDVIIVLYNQLCMHVVTVCYMIPYHMLAEA